MLWVIALFNIESLLLLCCLDSVSGFFRCLSDCLDRCHLSLVSSPRCMNSPASADFYVVYLCYGPGSVTQSFDFCLLIELCFRQFSSFLVFWFQRWRS